MLDIQEVVYILGPTTTPPKIEVLGAMSENQYCSIVVAQNLMDTEINQDILCGPLMLIFMLDIKELVQVLEPPTPPLKKYVQEPYHFIKTMNAELVQAILPPTSPTITAVLPHRIIMMVFNHHTSIMFHREYNITLHVPI